MRTLHFHSLTDLHKPQWFNYELHLPRLMREPGFWAAVIFISLIVIASLLAIFGPASPRPITPYPVFYP